MDAPGTTGTPADGDVETIRLQAEEHPLIEDLPPATAAEHCLRLMHLRAYDEAVGHAAGCDVLDVGCNTGYGTIRFVPVAGRVAGVDVSARAIDAARGRAVDGRPEFVVTTGFALPFPDDSFDLVTSFQVLEHVPDAPAFLRELERVARPGGTIILATPNAATRLYPGMIPWNRFHVREYLATELRDLLGGLFPEVSILGMFGAPELYETEIRRVDAARRRIRRKEEAAGAAAAREVVRASATRKATTRPARPWPIRFARALLPATVRSWLRSVVRPGPVLDESTGTTTAQEPAPPAFEAPSMDLEIFMRFSVKDLYYAGTELDRAMDLLAICRLGEAGGPRATLGDRSGAHGRPPAPMGM